MAWSTVGFVVGVVVGVAALRLEWWRSRFDALAPRRRTP